MNLNPFQRKAIQPQAKNISVGELDQFMRYLLNTQPGGTSTQTTSQLRRSVPWLFRAIDTIAQKVSDFPFEIQNDAGDVIDASDDWTNALEFTTNFQQLLFKLSASCNLHGCAYLKPMSNRLAQAQGIPSELRYWVAASIKPMITEANGLEYFERRINIARPPERIPVEDLIYFWLPDPDVELGVPLAYPALAALNAAGVLASLDKFFHEHTENGLVKAFIAAVKGAPPFGSEQGNAVKEKIEEGLNKDLGGQRNAGKIRAINADTVSITAIGEGLKELENVALTDEKRADIAVALNMPATYIWSGDAGGIGGAGVSKEDTYRLMDNNIVPMFNFLACILNEQLFSDLGYKLVGLPETLDVFQEDDVARSQASAAYATMISSDPVAAKFVMEHITSIDLDEEAEAELDALIADKQANADKMAQQLAQKPPANPNDPNAPPTQDNSAPDSNPADNTDPNAQAKSIIAGQFKRYAAKGKDVSKFDFGILTEAERKQLKAAEYKALPPTDARAVDEAALREQIAAVLAKQLNQVAAGISKKQPVNYFDLTKELRIELQEGLAGIAAQQLTRQSNQIGISYDPAAIDLAAHEWAKRYAYSLVSNLDDKSQAVIQNAVTLYTEAQGMTLGDLKDALRPAFGDTRADAISVTETSRAYFQSQVIQKDLLAQDGIEMEMIWYTERDNLVCPLCGPLNNKPESEWDGAEIPRHVNCRCDAGLRMKR